VIARAGGLGARARAHRARLPAAYNGYARVDADPIYDADSEPEQMLLRPLFFTSYLIDDFLDEASLFGARSVILSSASSKTRACPSRASARALSRRRGHPPRSHGRRPRFTAGSPAEVLLRARPRVAKRTADWGRDGFEGRLAEAWCPYLQWCEGWLEVIEGQGPQALADAYLDPLDGRIDPAKAHVLSLPR
jgi:hypothetical protein